MTQRGLDRRVFLTASSALPLGGLLLGAAPALAQQDSAFTNQRSDPLPDPANREGHYVDVNGARIFVEESGEGEPMLLLHGYPLSGALFARVRDDLGQRYRVITVDHRGYGLSEAPGVPGSIEIYAEDALAVMDQLGIGQAIIGGMSMGGPIAFEMYRRAPDRFRGMILIDTIAAPASTAEAGLWLGVAKMVRESGIESILPFLIKDMLTGDTRMNRPALVAYLETIMLEATQEAGIGGAIALARRPDQRPLLPEIAVPTLVYVGLEDTIYPFEIAQQMNSQIRDSELAIIPGAAHAAILEAPRRSAEAILSWAEQIS